MATKKQKNRRQFWLILPLFFVCVSYGSCGAKIAAEQFGSREEKKIEETIITALAPNNTDSSEEAGQKPDGSNPETAVLSANIVLERGNYWIAGIPGFGENALSAFFGEYRIPDSKETVKVWLTREFIYYNNWTRRSSMSAIRVEEKMENTGLITASPLNEEWTIMIQFPLGMEFSVEEQNRIIINLNAKLSGLPGQGQNISFPAFISYLQ